MEHFGETVITGFDEAEQPVSAAAVSAHPNEIKAVKQKALNEVFRKEVEVLDETTRELVDRMLSYMEKKCIGIPMKAAREALVEAQRNGSAL